MNLGQEKMHEIEADVIAILSVFFFLHIILLILIFICNFFISDPILIIFVSCGRETGEDFFHVKIVSMDEGLM